MNNSKTNRARGFRQFAAGMLLYTGIVLTTGFLMDAESVPTTLGVLLALLPMAAVVWAMAGWLRAIRTFDELQQKVFAEAGLISLGLTAAVTFTYGFLEALVNLPSLSMFVVVPFIGFTFALALPFAKRRFT